MLPPNLAEDSQGTIDLETDDDACAALLCLFTNAALRYGYAAAIICDGTLPMRVRGRQIV